MGTLARASTRPLGDTIHYVRHGRKLVGYTRSARVPWLQTKIFGDKIRTLRLFSEWFMFPATSEYLDRGKIKTKGIMNKTFKLEQFQEARDPIKHKSAIKAAIVFN